MKSNPSKISVIVVDDDKDIVSMMCDLLHIAGINVLGVGYNGKEAVDLYKKLRPDVVFLDIMMPEYDGFYALENIRKIDSEAKMLMVTADIRSETKERLQDVPSLEIVYKAFDLNDLLVGLNKLLTNSSNSMVYQGATYSMMPELTSD